MRITSTCLLTTAIGLASTPAVAQTLPDDLALSPFITSGISEPVALRHAGDGSNRIFIVQKNGTILVGQLGPDGSPPATLTPFLSRSVTTSSESGLLGLAFHPDFASNGYFYVAFTAPGAEPRLGSAPDQVIARYSVSGSDPNVADPGSRLDIIRIPDLAGNHNGGDLHFGPDGYLFVISGRCLSTVVLTLVCIFLTSSCHSMTRTVAERCVLVDVHGEEDQELIPWLDAFASEHRLMPEKSHPLAARYQLFVAQRLVAEIDYTVGMGAHGAVLTLFRYDETLNEGLPRGWRARHELHLLGVNPLIEDASLNDGRSTAVSTAASSTCAVTVCRRARLFLPALWVVSAGNTISVFA